MCCFLSIFFFKQKTAYEMRISDWSSDVCSSDLDADGDGTAEVVGAGRRADELGTRDYSYERSSYNLTGGLRGDFDIGGSDWRWDAFFQYQRNRTRSEEHTSELQSLMRISYAVFCLKKKKQTKEKYTQTHHN